MAGIVLVTKPSFLFADNDHLVLNGSWVGNNISNNWRKQYEEGINLYFSLSGLKAAIWSGRERQIEISCSESLWVPSTFANWTITIIDLLFVTRISGQFYLRYLNINFNINFDSVP